ncbi:MAG TPA: CDP-alcohol phosphatidyltransferase family protein [Ornithinibacter sp.]|nr:CDP-alcohol phosphatidyltransferase family protein [Ornithinibacter sp.]
MSRLADPVTTEVAPPPSRMPLPGNVVRLTVGLASLMALLAVLTVSVGLGVGAWVVAVGCAAVVTTLVMWGLAADPHLLGPADLVTLSRALLACAAVALTVELLAGHPVTAPLLTLGIPALALDAVDGRVARRTGTVTAFGGRFDGEVDAFLILVLSVAAAPTVGWWVLAAGLVRYAFAVAGWFLPWLRAPLEFRYWRKVVTATVGIALVVAVADVLPAPLTTAVVLVALALLAESFGRDVWWLWRRRERVPATAGPPRVWRRSVAAGATVLSLALVWFALVAPTRPDRLTPGAFLRLPVEAVALAAVALVVSGRSARAVALVVGLLLGVVTLLKVLDLGTFTVLDRPFNVVTDRGQLGSGFDFVRDSLGPWAAWGSAVGAVLLVVAALLCLPLALGRLGRVVSRHRTWSTRVVPAVAAVWVVCALSGLQVSPGGAVAAADAGPFVAEKVRAATTAYRDESAFTHALSQDPYGNPASADLSALAGKDVVLAFVESYGRVAVDGPESAGIRTLLDDGTARLQRLGWTASSGWLTSPTFGGSSWLAHSTLQSGLTVGDQVRYDRLLSSPRTTLSSAFGRAGWRTVAVLPSTHDTWPQGQVFYRFDRVYDGSALGYAGPRFGFSAMPDQFTLAAFDRLELATPHPPLMAELELTSSHGPWAPLPTTVDPADLGDGSVFDGIEADAVTAAQLWSDRSAVPGAYRASIAYSLTSLLSFVESHADDDLVVVMLGDHQPSTIVSGFGGDREVPVTVIARDPKVVARVASWGWQSGLRPSDTGPVWPMAAFRDRFLTAYSSRAPR